MEHRFIDDNGNEVIENDFGIFVNGDCVAGFGSARDLGTHDEEVINGTGYYDENGNFHRYREVD